MTDSFSGVVLAGGAGTRLNGITKSNIVINGKSIISRITETIGDIFEEIIIVTNNKEEFREYGKYKLASDQFLEIGPLGGIHAALNTSSKEALFVFAGDMPLINKELIIKLVENFNSKRCEVLIPRINKYIEPLHAIYSASILKSLEEYLSRDHSFAVREFLKFTDVRYLQLEDTEEVRKSFTNINSPDDILNVEKILSGRS